MNIRLSVFVLACALGAAPSPGVNRILDPEARGSVTSLAFSPTEDDRSPQSADQTIRLWSVDSVRSSASSRPRGKPIRSAGARTAGPSPGADNGSRSSTTLFKAPAAQLQRQRCVESSGSPGRRKPPRDEVNVVHIGRVPGRTRKILRRRSPGHRLQRHGTMLPRAIRPASQHLRAGGGKRYRKCVKYTETVAVAFSRDGRRWPLVVNTVRSGIRRPDARRGPCRPLATSTASRSAATGNGRFRERRQHGRSGTRRGRGRRVRGAQRQRAGGGVGGRCWRREARQDGHPVVREPKPGPAEAVDPRPTCRSRRRTCGRTAQDDHGPERGAARSRRTTGSCRTP